MWSYWTKDKEEIDWESKGDLEYARTIVFNESCEACHTNLLPKGVSDEAIIAHLYYEENRDKLSLQCIDCHLDAGHYNPNYVHGQMTSAPVASQGEIYADSTVVTSFENYVETIPGTSASISMIAIPGGEFVMGSSLDESYARANEMPQRRVTVSPFFMAEVEITWDQYWAFYGETMSEGRTPPAVVYENNSRPDVDAVSGPTAPFGSPDQGWGMGERPAITMTHYAAETFCQWLSLKTGKKYRLPTEAEWEYAVRGGTTTPYFFEGSPKDYTNSGFWNEMFGADTTKINSYVIYANNSKNRSQEPAKVLANPFGLKNMLGNVMEYCSDRYAENAYSLLSDGDKDPKGPDSGEEYVVRGGTYASDAADLRSAARGRTHHDDWLKTDPQNPKSIWWYSDIRGIGFRVVCEVPESINN
jgi:formylglycine-generating enzyme required for sulfatase activity